MLQRLLLLWLVLLSAIAVIWPVDSLAGFDPFVAYKPYLWHFIAATMFAIGWMLPRDEVKQVARRWPLVLGGTAVQFTTMPVLAWLVATCGGFDEQQFIGLIVVGCVPGAMASNVLTLMAKGNVSYSLSLTTSATLLSPLFVPLALMTALGQEIEFPVRAVMSQLCWAIVLPVVSGHLLGRSLPKWEQQAKRIGSTIANATILWIIAVVVALNRENITELVVDYAASIKLLGGLLTINLLGYLAGYGGGFGLRLPEPMRRALTLEIGMQNAGLGAALAANYFSPEAAIPAALYTFGCMFTGTILARIWANRNPETSDKSAKPH